MTHNKFFFSLALLLSISALQAMENGEMFKEIAKMAEEANDLDADIAKLNAWNSDAAHSKQVDETITNLHSIIKVAADARAQQTHNLPASIARNLESHKQLIKQIQEDRENESNDILIKSIPLSETIQDPFFKAQMQMTESLMQQGRIPEALEKVRQSRIYNFSQIEWLAKACKEFHTNNLETEETKNFTSNTLSNIEAIIQKLKSDK